MFPYEPQAVEDTKNHTCPIIPNTDLDQWIPRGDEFFARRAYCVGEAIENHVCPSVRPLSGVRCPVSGLRPSGPFSIRFQSSKMKIPVQFLRKRGPKRVPSATFGSKSEMDLGQRIIQIL